MIGLEFLLGFCKGSVMNLTWSLGFYFAYPNTFLSVHISKRISSSFLDSILDSLFLSENIWESKPMDSGMEKQVGRSVLREAIVISNILNNNEATTATEPSSK